jgi:non-heme chloroperoxidase
MATVRLHVQDSGGQGRPIILIHGWPLSGASWKAQIPALTAAGFRVIAYDRRGFGQSDKPPDGFDYDTLADDLAGLIEDKALKNASLVGFSMGGGEVARYIGNYGEQNLHSVVFAAAVPPCLMKSDDNPHGPLTPEKATELETALRVDRNAFFDSFTKDFFSANGKLMVSEADRQEALALCRQSDPAAALGCMKAWATTDFRADLPRVTVPTLVLHGDADATVPFEGSGARTHAMVKDSKLEVIEGGPHGVNVSHVAEFNDALVTFLKTSTRETALRT